jgi:hypothetical protein
MPVACCVVLHEVAEVDEVRGLALLTGEPGDELQRLRPGAGHRGGDLVHVRDRRLAEGLDGGVEPVHRVAVDDRHRDQVAVGLASG